MIALFLDLADRIDAALPQTQCRRCGYPDCRGYAEALAAGAADIDRCPPGGAEGVGRLARLTGRPLKPLDPACGTESPLALAWIDEAGCIGCTLCIQACPVDCIVGAPKAMHTVVASQCTGCGLCLPACPVDCIEMRPTGDPATGWAAWGAEQAAASRSRYVFRQQRLERDRHDTDARLAAKARAALADLGAHSRHTEPALLEAKRAALEAAWRRAQERLAAGTPGAATVAPPGASVAEPGAPR